MDIVNQISGFLSSFADFMTKSTPVVTIVLVILMACIVIYGISMILFGSRR